MARTVGMPDTDESKLNVPQADFSNVESGATTAGMTHPSGSNAAPTDMTRTGIQTSGAGETPRSGFAEVPVAPCIFGDYELIEEIARGGMGVVYRAKQSKLNRIVALKMILPGMLSSPTAVDRFYEEAKAAAHLDHPNIVPIYDIGEHDGQHYFTMGFIEGRSLRDLIRKETVSFAESVRLMKGIAEGVGFAHDHLIIHRDLKPDNVLIDKHGRPRITDFGLAKRTDATTGLTVTGQILGTPTYMSPEQALGGNRTIGTPTDIYAVGGILYYTLTGHPPFQGETMTEVLCQVITTPPNSPKMFNPSIPDELEAICMKCLEKEPQNRYASCWEFRDALIEWERRAGISTGSLGSLGGNSPSSPSSPKFGTEMTEDSLFAGLPKSFPSAGDKSTPPMSSKSTPHRKPWEYTAATPVMPAEPTPMPNERPSLELSGSRPIMLPSEKNPAVATEPPKKNTMTIVAVMAVIFAVTVLAVSQWPKWFPGAAPVEVVQKPDNQKPPVPEHGAINPPGVSAPNVPKQIEQPGVVPIPPAIKPPAKGKGLLGDMPAIKATRGDFEMKVKLLNGRSSPEGVYRFLEGEFFHIEVTPTEDCNIAIWSVNSDGSVEQMFPREDETNQLCPKGQTRRLPDRDSLQMASSGGIDQVWIVARNVPWHLSSGKVVFPAEATRPNPNAVEPQGVRFDALNELQRRLKYVKNQPNIRISESVILTDVISIPAK